MANEQNLTRAGIEIDSTEKAQRLGRLGGIASGKSKREKRKVREMLKDLLYNHNVKDCDGEDTTLLESIAKNYLAKAIEGQNPRYFEWITEQIDGKLQENIVTENKTYNADFTGWTKDDFLKMADKLKSIKEDENKD